MSQFKNYTSTIINIDNYFKIQLNIPRSICQQNCKKGQKFLTVKIFESRYLIYDFRFNAKSQNCKSDFGFESQYCAFVVSNIFSDYFFD